MAKLRSAVLTAPFINLEEWLKELRAASIHCCPLNNAEIMSHLDLIQGSINEHAAIITKLATLAPQMQEIAQRMRTCLDDGGKILWMGNGGSAADSQHLAAEMIGRFKRERRGLASIALTTDTSVLTSVGNDYGFDAIFARQIEAICSPHDVVVGISTSGNSKNILGGILVAKDLGAYTLGLLGGTGGELMHLCDSTLLVPSKETARIQEAHILIGHILCELVETMVPA